MTCSRPQYSADWGDYISFTHHLRKHADDIGSDLLVVDTGDRIEGNGLYDASTPKGLFQYDIYREQDVDIICVGNHELYQPGSADREFNTTVVNYKNNYIASNLDYIDPESGDQRPLTQRYRKFKTKNQGIEIVAFGFIFDFTGNANNTVVQKVEDTIKEPWFQDAIREDPDMFVVAGHIGLRMEEFRTIFTAIRKQNWHKPIAFFGGHAHVRDARKFDSTAFALASGRYFETIGWMSMDGIISKDDGKASASKGLSFTRKYIDNNLYGLYYHSNTNETTFDTKLGKRVSSMITRARKALNLDYRFGCAPKSLWMNRAEYPSDDSIYSWIENEVFPEVVVHEKRKDKPRLAIMNTGGIRFDIFKGPFTRDSTYTVSPFVSGFKYVPDVPYDVAKKVIGLLNSGGTIFTAAGQDTNFLTIPQQMFTDASTAPQGDEARLELRGLHSANVPMDDDTALTGGYTTKDDLGTDGDDTVHEPLQFHRVPNCIQSEIAFPEDGDPDTVDVVFIDFIQPWVIPALKFSGGDYSDDDVETYMDGTFTYKMSEWIKNNWNGSC